MRLPDFRIDAVPLLTVLTGRAVPFTRPGSASAIAKQPRHDRIEVHAEGLHGDEQGDRRVHGGPDKAIHHYALDHYPRWRDDLGAHPLLQASGAFGENLSTLGMTESTVCLGDRYAVGSAVLEVSQGRMPCWKLNDRFGMPDLARRVQDTGRTGWYYRVLQPGALRAGDTLTLLERPHPTWPLARLSTLLFQRVLDFDELRAAQVLPLVPSWRKLVDARLARGEREDWSRRLDGPDPAATTTSPTVAGSARGAPSGE